MIVWAPPRRGAPASNGGLGDAAPSWYARWVSSGRNDGGQILAFVQSTAGNDFVSAEQVATSTGKFVPYFGQPSDYAGGDGEPHLYYAMPDYANNPGGWFLDHPEFYSLGEKHPGDDVMAYAIERWALSDYAKAAAIPQPSASTAAALPVPTVAQFTAQESAAVSAATGTATGGAATGGAASDSTGSSVVSGFSSLPWWAWALGVGVVLFLAMRD
jgi:hypothetical protein